MTSTHRAFPDHDGALTPLGYALPPNGPVPGLAKRIIELLRIGGGNLVIDLCWHDDLSSGQIVDYLQPRDERFAVSPFDERLARLLTTSGVRTLQMGALSFGQFPMRHHKVLLRGGFSRFHKAPQRLLAPLFAGLEPAARFLVVDSAPSPDAPLFAEGLCRWQRRHLPAEAIARHLTEAGFTAEIDAVTCVRYVSCAECFAWIRSRAWPILENFSDAELQRGLRELRQRYDSQRMVKFTSRFELVLGTKPGTRAPTPPGRARRSCWPSTSAGVPDADVNKIKHENALRHFQLDAFKHRPKAKCRVGALRAESPNVDMRLKSQGGKPPQEKKGRFVSTKDVTTQLASAFSTPAE